MKKHIMLLGALAGVVLALAFVTMGCENTTDSGPSAADVAVSALNLTSLVTAPVKDVAPITTAINAAQYTGTVAWQTSKGAAFTGNAFAASTVYQARLTLSVKSGYTFTGLAANSFTYAGATATNEADSGVVTITFPATEAGATTNAAVPVITAQPQNASYAQNGTATALAIMATASDGGTLMYQWYSNAANSNSGGTLIAGATAASYTPLTTTLGTIYYYVIVTNTNNSVNGTKTATAISDAATIIVSVRGSLDISIGSDYGEITITGSDGTNTISKNGTPQTLTLSASGYTGVVWYVDGNAEGIADSGSGIAINAGEYRTGSHTITFTGKRGNVPYSRAIPFTVAE